MFQALLDGLGAILAFFYSLIPNYGVAIIMFTLVIRLVLLPLGVRQVRSQQAMQAIQPKVKQLQQKYKGNRQKISEETMALYREHGVNPLGGCLPILAQMPVLIALFAVLQFPKGFTHIPHNEQERQIGVEFGDSKLYVALTDEANPPRFLGANLLCNALQAGQQVDVDRGTIVDAPDPLDCGSGFPVRIPYYLFGAAMIATTYYQQRQMQRASPVVNPQQQMLTRIMPILFGVWGFIFPAGLVVYWTTTNLVQIGQQRFLLRHQFAAPPSADGKAKPALKSGQAGQRPARRKPSTGTASSTRKPATGTGSSTRSSRSGGTTGRQSSRPSGRAKGSPPPKGGSAQGGSGGGQDGGDRKKRRKR